VSRTVALAVGAIVGALLATAPGVASSLARPAPLVLAGLSLVAVAGARIRGPIAGTMGAAALGLLVVTARVVAVPLAAPLASLPGGDGPWTARVATVSTPRDGHQRATIDILIEPPVRVALDAPRYPAIQPADRIEVDGALRPPPDDDYGAYLRRSGVDATLRSRTVAVFPDTGDPARALEGLRRAGGDALAVALPEPEAGLAAGILIGLRDRVDRDLAAVFTTAGVSHVVAISGWNIAIVALLVDRLLASAPRRRRRLVTLAAIAIYTVMTGASASVLRAAAMAIAVTVARESGRAGSAQHALALAVTGLIVLDPAVVGDGGFQLSALATAGLIVWATPITDWLRERRGGRLPAWLCVGLGVSLAAQVATLPVVLLSFGRLALLSPLLNLAVVPLVPLAMAGGTLALLVGAASLAGLPASIATLLAVPGWLPLAALVGIVQVGAALPLASVTLEPPTNVVAAAVIPVALVARRVLPRIRPLLGVTRSRRTPATTPATPATGPERRDAPSPSWREAIRRPIPRAAIGVLVLAIASTGLAVGHQPDGRLRIVALDVGQGDAILVEGPQGSRLLIDGGPDPERLVGALDARLPPWDRRLDILVLSHPHEDHVAGLPLLLERYRVGRTFDVGMRGRGPGYAAWGLALALRDVPRGRLATGDALVLDGARLDVLWPDPGTVPAEPPDDGSGINNVSVVLLGQFGRQRFLLMGDVEEEVDPILLERGLPPVDLVKVAHHGSRTSSTQAFLNAVRPRVALVSAGARNPYGHPAPATLERLAAGGARIGRTDLDGTVEVAMDGRTSTLITERRRGAAAAPARPLELLRVALGCPIPTPLPAAGAAEEPGPDRALRYDHRHVRARPGRGGTSPPLTEPPAVVPAPFAWRGGGRGLARRAGGARGPHHRSLARGGRGPAARHRQAAPARRPRPPPAARRRGRGLADRLRVRRARAGGCRASGDKPRR
jgi:competence protein ComEC